MPAPLICFVGVDGSGKTALIKRLITNLNRRGLPNRYVWFRSPYFFTFALLVVSKLLGMTKYTGDGPSRITEYDFHRQPFRILYPLVVFLDTLIHYAVKLVIPLKFGAVVVCDRWVPDIIIDIMIDTRNARFQDSLIGRLFNDLASRTAFTVFVDASDHILDARRPEAKLDPSTRTRRKLYHSLASGHPGLSVCTDDDIENGYNQLLRCLGMTGIDLHGSEKSYANLSGSWLRPLVKRRWFVIAANWAVQGTLGMSRDELAFRFALEFGLVATMLAVLQVLLPLAESVLLSVFIAHTINWAFNGNFWATQKFFGRRFSSAKKMEFLARIREEMRSSDGIAAIAAFGSLSRGLFSDYSDLDLRIVRKRGWASWMRANLFTLRLRSRAFVIKLPIDVLVRDSINELRAQISPSETPVLVYDPGGLLSTIRENAIPLDRVITHTNTERT